MKKSELRSIILEVLNEFKWKLVNGTTPTSVYEDDNQGMLSIKGKNTAPKANPIPTKNLPELSDKEIKDALIQNARDNKLKITKENLKNIYDYIIDEKRKGRTIINSEFIDEYMKDIDNQHTK